MIRSIKLKQEDILFLKEVCDIDILTTYASKITYEKKSNSWILILETADMESITDELSETLIDKGITNGEINSLGKKIDDFFDKFNHYEQQSIRINIDIDKEIVVYLFSPCS